jgi:predicted double-glycine peptidase
MSKNTQKEILKVKPFQETLHGGYCGPASLKMVLGYYGVEKTEEEVAVKCGHNPKLGTSDKSIKKTAEGYGFKVEIQNEASLDDIQRWLDKKVPVIVDWFTRGRSDYDDSKVPDGHYSVVIGLDKENIYLQDPEIGKMRALTRGDFMCVWFDFKGRHITSWQDMVIRQLIAIYPNSVN